MQQAPEHPRIALVEDDPDQRESLLAWLRMNNHQVWAVESAEAFYKQAIVNPVDILIIDLGLPGEDGIETIKHIRESSEMGIIVVSARSSAAERVTGMKTGADQYLVKPIVPEELAVCIETLWQRIRPHASTTSSPSATPTDSSKTAWRLFSAERTRHAPNGCTVKLTPSESIILEACAHTTKPLKREDLIESLGGNPKSFSMHRIDAHLSRLRKKVSDSCALSLPLSSLPGARLEFIGTIELC
jgi:two-component system response regulator PhoP